MSENDENRKLKITFFSLVTAVVVLVIVDGILFLNRKPSANSPIEQPPTSGEPGTASESTIFKYTVTGSNGSSYEVKLYGSGELQVAAGEATNTVTLTEEEIGKVKRLVDSGSYGDMSLAATLRDLSMGDNILLKISDIEEVDDPEYVNFYRQKDLNGDGIVTYRESGNRALDVMIAEINTEL